MAFTIGGFTLDEWISYTPDKKVWIRDKWIGLLYYILLLAILCYIVFYQILWNNEDFESHDVTGMARMWLSHPTLDECDPQLSSCRSHYRSLRQLKYCDVSPEAIDSAQACRFQGKNSIAPHGEVDEKLFIPTAVELIRERKVCEPSEANDWICENEFQEEPGSDCRDPGGQEYNCRERGGRTGQYFFIADVERFKIQFTSAYEEGAMRGTSLESYGFYYDCEDWGNETGVQTWEMRLNSTKSRDNHVPRCKSRVKRRELQCLAGHECSQDDKPHLASPFLPEALHIDEMRSLGPSFQEPQPPVLSLAQGGGRRMRGAGRGGAGARGRADGHGGPLPEGVRGRRRVLAAVQDAPHRAKEGHNHTHSHGTEEKLQFSTYLGDTFTIGKLLELAGIGSLDDLRNRDGWTARQSGTVLEVQVIYNNMYRLWSNLGYTAVEYTYKVREMPMAYVSRQVLAGVQPADYPASRDYEVQYGIVVWFRVSGAFGSFHLLYLMVLLTAGFALVAGAGGVTDLVAIYGHPRHKNYFQLKYEVSPDFEKMWYCTKCGFYNHDRETTCRGVDRWTTADDEHTEVCGAPRHQDA